MKLTDYIVSYLEEKGIRDFFGFQGTLIAHLVDSIERNPLVRNHSCYHEQGASFAACGYALAKNACACAYATSGPGAVNLLSGVANAYFDSLPVVFLTGQLNTYEYVDIPGLRQQGYQEIDIVSMARPVTKYAVQITEPQQIVEELDKAYHIAVSGRPGPVLLDLPMNIQRGEMEPGTQQNRKAAEPDREAAARAACGILEALKTARRPAILLGNGVRDRGSIDSLLAFARKHSIPVITSVLARSALSGTDPLNFGCIGGAYGHRYANMIANAKSDLLICIGISLCTRQIGVKVQDFARNARIIRVDLDGPNLKRDIHENGQGEEKYQADAGEVIRFLTEFDQECTADFGDWLSVCNEIRSSLEEVDRDTPERVPNRIVEKLGEYLQDKKAVAVDVGQHMVWCYQSLPCAPGQKFLFSGGHGAMGYALPAALGAYYASGGPVACICGDGAFQMNIQELQWVRRENVPLKMIVMNNEALGMIQHLQRDYFDSLFAGTVPQGGFTSCEFARVAEAYGIPAMKLKKGEDMERAGRFLCAPGPGLLEVMLEGETFAYPKTCLGEPIHNPQPYAPKELYERLLAL